MLSRPTARSSRRGNTATSSVRLQLVVDAQSGAMSLEDLRRELVLAVVEEVGGVGEGVRRSRRRRSPDALLEVEPGMERAAPGTADPRRGTARGPAGSGCRATGQVILPARIQSGTDFCRSSDRARSRSSPAIAAATSSRPNACARASPRRAATTRPKCQQCGSEPLAHVDHLPPLPVVCGWRLSSRVRAGLRDGGRPSGSSAQVFRAATGVVLSSSTSSTRRIMRRCHGPSGDARRSRTMARGGSRAVPSSRSPRPAPKKPSSSNWARSLLGDERTGFRA